MILYPARCKQDALLLHVGIPLWLPTPVSLHNGIDTITVEACHQKGNGIVTASAGGSRSNLVTRPFSGICKTEGELLGVV